jgi:hypothetical protein
MTAPPAPLVFISVAQRDLMQLLNLILVERDILPGADDQPNDLDIAGNLLLVTRLEGLDCEVGEQLLDIKVRELATLDTGERTDTLDVGDPVLLRGTSDSLAFASLHVLRLGRVLNSYRLHFTRLASSPTRTG